MAKVVLATKNPGKVREFRTLAGDRNWDIISLNDFPSLVPPEETGTTFRENAMIKAMAVFNETGITTLADDSGLEVDFLDGMPGVYSARFAGEPSRDEKNNKKLLSLLKGVPEGKRTARFRCTIAIASIGETVLFCEGICEGMIGQFPQGDKGFGYDPLFWIPELGKTMAQLSLEEKNRISHRGKAFREALPILEQLLVTA